MQVEFGLLVHFFEKQMQKEEKNGDMHSVHLSFLVFFCRMLCWQRAAQHFLSLPSQLTQISLHVTEQAFTLYASLVHLNKQ